MSGCRSYTVDALVNIASFFCCVFCFQKLSISLTDILDKRILSAGVPQSVFDKFTVSE